jgi:GTP-sensing pleiotropic transcriptional regulator CodY
MNYKVGERVVIHNPLEKKKDHQGKVFTIVEIAKSKEKVGSFLLYADTKVFNDWIFYDFEVRPCTPLDEALE